MVILVWTFAAFSRSCLSEVLDTSAPTRDFFLDFCEIHIGNLLGTSSLVPSWVRWLRSYNPTTTAAYRKCGGPQPHFCEWVQDRYPFTFRNLRPPALSWALRVYKLTGETFHLTPNTSILSAWTRNPTILPTQHPSAYLTHSILPEGNACSGFSLECVPLGAFLCPSSLPRLTNPSFRADVDLDIPSIAVIGWQSAGKSSLIEAISGITLPRASGTCTRSVLQDHHIPTALS
jgi:hypothetical protein